MPASTEDRRVRRVSLALTLAMAAQAAGMVYLLFLMSGA